jgi:hypothetical protein
MDTAVQTSHLLLDRTRVTVVRNAIPTLGKSDPF